MECHTRTVVARVLGLGQERQYPDVHLEAAVTWALQLSMGFVLKIMLSKM